MGHLAIANATLLQELNERPGTTVTLRIDTGAPPIRLRQDAEEAALSGDLRSMKHVGAAAHARSPWDEFRVWDPGDWAGSEPPALPPSAARAHRHEAGVRL